MPLRKRQTETRINKQIETKKLLETSKNILIKAIAMSKASSKQEGGSHYKQMAIQPIEYIQANSLDYLEGNVIKYISRHKSKNGQEDIKKAMHYCQLILEYQYKD